jgi:tetrahydromethanopterin S-methyltransferase subunit A
MTDHNELEIALHEIEEGIVLPKCQQCGCMAETLEQLGKSIQRLPEELTSIFSTGHPTWAAMMKPIRYSCLGCKHCYAGAAQNAFTAAFPETESLFGLSCEIQFNSAGWPPVVGEYIVVDPSAPVAVCTLASQNYSKQIADLNIPGLAIVGKLETENIGIDKLIKNTIANPNLHFLILAGIEPAGHHSGQTLLALSENGVDENGRVVGSKGKRPILMNVNETEIESFRSQIKMIDLIGCECTDCLREKIAEIHDQTEIIPLMEPPCSCTDGSCHDSASETNDITSVLIDESDKPVVLDKAGYFVILPIPERKIINVEHYSYDNRLLHVIEGSSARTLYLKIIAENWVSELSHAAYLGRELAKAEMNLIFGTPYHQDAA